MLYSIKGRKKTRKRPYCRVFLVEFNFESKNRVLNSFQHQRNERVDAIFVVWIGFACHTVGYDHTTSHRFVTHQFGEPCECTTFHFKVGEAKVVVAEIHYLIVSIGIGQRKTKSATLILSKPL